MSSDECVFNLRGGKVPRIETNPSRQIKFVIERARSVGPRPARSADPLVSSKSVSILPAPTRSRSASPSLVQSPRIRSPHPVSHKAEPPDPQPSSHLVANNDTTDRTQQDPIGPTVNPSITTNTEQLFDSESDGGGEQTHTVPSSPNALETTITSPLGERYFFTSDGLVPASVPSPIRAPQSPVPTTSQVATGFFNTSDRPASTDIMDSQHQGKQTVINSSLPFGQHFDFEQRPQSGAHSISGILTPNIELLTERLAQQDEILARQAKEIFEIQRKRMQAEDEARLALTEADHIVQDERRSMPTELDKVQHRQEQAERDAKRAMEQVDDISRRSNEERAYFEELLDPAKRDRDHAKQAANDAQRQATELAEHARADRERVLELEPKVSRASNQTQPSAVTCVEKRSTCVCDPCQSRNPKPGHELSLNDYALQLETQLKTRMQPTSIAVITSGHRDAVMAQDLTSSYDASVPVAQPTSTSAPMAATMERPTTQRDIVFRADSLIPGKSAISDSVIAPQPFSNSTETDAESWLNYFTRYVEYKGMTEHDSMQLFGLLMRDEAADWLQTLHAEEAHSYPLLLEAFKEAYCPIREVV